MTIRIATFNVENLFSRFDFSGRTRRERRLLGGYDFENPAQFELARMVFTAVHADDMRQLTALALADTDADVVCLQEVDSEDSLEVFYENYLKPVLHQRFAAAAKGLPPPDRQAISSRFFYDRRHVVSGNDTRGIDVALLSRCAVTLRSHAGLTFDFIADAGLDWPALVAIGEQRDKRVFRRDCLEVDVDLGARQLTIFICHFKSMQTGTPQREDPAATRPIRHAEALAVRRIIEQRFADRTATAHWMICGDLNDIAYADGKAVACPALAPLLEGGFAINAIERLPAEERWTHYHPESDEHVQLDYILLSPALAAANPRAVPEVIRRGQPWRVPGLADVPRYPRVGWDRPNASDHCPVVIEIDIPG
ncbi:endonuclease/exonuclease/phosphatase family protein [Roseiarcaceae bacterium H3SJ34-1]|uniref:endonuclease/exonuclease/phosphatase family protein n=1 Tax=Terripilifer ovatus TaxID=3032367 RepID=UPI003AB99F89|nr:endonuclease/exonuclease/phosphatase family protein [Roseiarcaceae bacterium H3SJ34-1]